MKLSSSNLPDKVHCPTSKSYAARALIIASLLERKFTLKDLPLAQDTQDLIQVLKTIGLDIVDGNVLNSFPACELKDTNEVKLDVGEGGTTIRFLLPLLALGSNRYELQFAGEMVNRPMDDLYNSLRGMDVKVEKTKTGVNIQGPMNMNKKVSVNCELSSQFASGFELLRTIGLENFEYVNLNHSQKYFEMTQLMVDSLSQKSEYIIPVDMSSLGYFICYAILNKTCLVENVFGPDKYQADSKIFEFLNDIGADFCFTDSGLELNKSTFQKGLDVDGRDCIDLVPTLIFLASFISHKSEFNFIEKLKFKESDRLEECLKILDFFKVNYIYDISQDKLIINGKENYSIDNFEYSTTADHRMVMISSLFLKQNSGGTIYPSEVVRKSFPNFFQYFF